MSGNNTDGIGIFEYAAILISGRLRNICRSFDFRRWLCGDNVLVQTAHLDLPGHFRAFHGCLGARWAA